ncbi:hypothetical protein BU15DRAFT_9762, partial [Melanogaster broomeanus]
ITLNCLVYGQDVHSVFPVEISKTKSIGALKDLIKEKNPVDFVDVDAKALVLYKVSLRADDRLDDELKDLELDHMRPLFGGNKLSRIFSNHKDDENLHIII